MQDWWGTLLLDRMDPFGKNAKTIAFIILGLALTVFVVYFSLKMSEPNIFCDGPPYIYATFHDEASNIYKYSRNGCLLDTSVLVGGPEHALSSHLIELRSIVFGTLGDDEALYVADAYSDDSYLNIYSRCDKHGKRGYITTATATVVNPGINHLYGIAFDPDGNVLVSSQHTDNVIRLYKDTFEPMPIPSMMNLTTDRPFEYYPGTFIQFGTPTVHDVKEQGVRDVIAVQDKIWVANEDDNSVRVIDAVTGLVEDIISVSSPPIGLLYSPVYGVVFVSAKGQKDMGLVHAVSVESKKILRRFKSKRMTHPTGMAIFRSTLFVADQKLGQIVSFNIHSGRFLRIIVSDMPLGIEKLLMSDC
jgi:YVTN family beta-propeller protein